MITTEKENRCKERLSPHAPQPHSLTLRIAEHRVSPIKNLTGACHANPNSRFGCELSLRGFNAGPNRFQCRIKHARNQCAERQQRMSRLLLHAEARYGPTV